MTVKTIFLKQIQVKEALKRVHSLGILDYSVSWGVDMDEQLNAITFRISSTTGMNAKTKEEEIIKTIESFLKAIDKQKENQ